MKLRIPLRYSKKTVTNTSNWKRYRDISKMLVFKIMKIVEKNGSSFAFPSRSIYFENLNDICYNPAKK